LAPYKLKPLIRTKLIYR